MKKIIRGEIKKTYGIWWIIYRPIYLKMAEVKLKKKRLIDYTHTHTSEGVRLKIICNLIDYSHSKKKL
jgi:hypothetical protein